MPHKLPKYVQSYTDNRGKRRYYFRRNGFARVPLPAPWDDGFLKAYEAAKANKGPAGNTHTPTAGTIGAVIVAYLASPEYQGLAEQTKKVYRRLLDRLRKDTGDDRVADFQPRHIKAMIAKRGKESGVDAGNNLRRVLRLVFKFAVDHNIRSDDPTAGVSSLKRPRAQKSDGFRTWTENDIETFITKHPLGTRAHLALCLLLYTGQRRSDVVKFGPKSIKGRYDPSDFTGRKLTLTQQKTGKALTLPIHPVLAEVLAKANIPPNAPAFLRTQYGKAYTGSGFSNCFATFVREAGIKDQASPHGLRKAAARRLAEAGCSVKLIAAVTGHASLKEIERYTNAADQERLADMAMRSISHPTGSPVQP
jgi:site-specific recombinase XerD